MDLNKSIFKKTSLGNIFEDIYSNTKKKDKLINELIFSLQEQIKSINDAIMLVPLISGYLDTSVKNNEHLIKMAAIIQRGMGNGDGNVEDLLSDKDKEEIMEEIKKMNSDESDV